MRTLKLITRFYSGIFLANFLVTLSCAYLMKIYRVEAYKIIGLLFWFKILTIGIMLYSSIHYKKEEMYYYQNLGVSKRLLAISTSIFDFMLWLVVMAMAYR